MKKIIIIICVFVAIMVISFVGLLSNFFLIGKKMDVRNIVVRSILVTNSEIKLSGTFFSSADAYKGYKYRVKDDSVYITIYKTYVSPIYRNADFSFEINGDFSNIDRVYLEENDGTKVIWPSVHTFEESDEFQISRLHVYVANKENICSFVENPGSENVSLISDKKTDSVCYMPTDGDDTHFICEDYYPAGQDYAYGSHAEEQLHYAGRTITVDDIKQLTSKEGLTGFLRESYVPLGTVKNFFVIAPTAATPMLYYVQVDDRKYFIQETLNLSASSQGMTTWYYNTFTAEKYCQDVLPEIIKNKPIDGGDI